ncbi:MAG: molybdopterin-dependent oxidoreductase [Vicinamibacterales bacterium]|nr:molybdopterin-dependent oxidoreductase [Vicinamibacterales bacterium]
MIKQGMAGTAWLATLGIPESVWALQPGDEPVVFTDYTEAFRVEASAGGPRVRCFDLRRLTSWATPNDEFYTFHQTEAPTTDTARFRLRVGGLVERPREFTLEEIRARADRRDEAVTLECSGNSPRAARMNGLLSNGVWTGVGLRSILEECGVKAEAREVVFLGLDMEREKKWQARNEEFEAPHGRSVYLQDALHPDAMLAFALNGQPLPHEQGFPLRLILPGWYGMTQIKWLSRIEVIDRRYEGQHQVRNYLSLRSVDTPEGPLWLDMSISKTNMKSAIARVTRRRAGGAWEYTVSGAAWGGRAPIAAVEVQVDEGAWQRATVEAPRGQYAWRLWSLTTRDLAPGPHTLASRATNADGLVQPTTEELRRSIQSGREDFAIWRRTIEVGA